ncbi:PGPGW domain-containing protein [Porticoccaceae bacterium LTM1]|nr:PGPGW domain-containing protein [Porticoccaceae bacterium LTM1]
MIETIEQWFNAHQSILTWLGVLSLFTFIISLITLPWLVSRIPEDYFLYSKRHPSHWSNLHPAIRSILLAGKNLLGAILLCGGFLMLFLPGQGLLTLAMGLLMMDYPGKYRLERKLVSYPKVLKSLNWLRAKAKHPPLKVD